MAAGLGTRLSPFTDLLPKPFFPVMGVPAIQFALDQLSQAGVSEIVVNIHYLPEESKRALRGLDYRGMKITVSDESSKLLGSAGGIREVLDQFEDEPFFLINADTLWAIDLRKLAHPYFSNPQGRPEILLGIVDRKDIPGQYREILRAPDGRITALGSHTSGGGFYGGVAIYHPSAFQHLNLHERSEFFEDVFTPSLTRGGVYSVSDSSLWLDMGTPELWWRSHLQWMSEYEKGSVPARWISRVEQESRRVESGLWIAKSLGSDIRVEELLSAQKLEGYFATADLPNLTLEGRVVLYGTCESGKVYREGIGWGGIWKGFS